MAKKEKKRSDVKATPPQAKTENPPEKKKGVKGTDELSAEKKKFGELLKASKEDFDKKKEARGFSLKGIFAKKPKQDKTKPKKEKVSPALRKTKSQAFGKLKKKRGWFAEREQHALVARGVEVRKKEVFKYKVIYSAFIIISLVLAMLSLINENFLSFAISIIIMILTVLCYMATLDPE
ncbi:hypothetical protein JXC34_07390, partial [Candidatus Woesearchaeota archaeon]|nr:hypothetical protein [Candidatus Woesearchaeota archaeon]